MKNYRTIAVATSLLLGYSPLSYAGPPANMPLPPQNNMGAISAAQGSNMAMTGLPPSAGPAPDGKMCDLAKYYVNRAAMACIGALGGPGDGGASDGLNVVPLPPIPGLGN